MAHIQLANTKNPGLIWRFERFVVVSALGALTEILAPTPNIGKHDFRTKPCSGDTQALLPGPVSLLRAWD